MNYKISGNDLLFNSKKVSFEHPIKSVLQKKDFLLVLLKVPAKVNYQRNIFGVSGEGEIIWQVEAPSYSSVDLYTSLWEENGEIVAGSWKGDDTWLDPKTGKILKQEFTR